MTKVVAGNSFGRAKSESVGQAEVDELVVIVGPMMLRGGHGEMRYGCGGGSRPLATTELKRLFLCYLIF